ncbi:TMEM175 family protein [Lentilactobacillus otakiensis]|uniref:TMEM175 family protein n=1 Tax=Lentilactobacillus otakiensis TaxID=481720 RepID=UPI003D16D9AF
MKKLKTRLDAFSDAVIAIILTIMVLDLTPVLRDNLNDYLFLSKQVGIYIISFAFVANMWYQHATLFNDIDDMSYRIMLYDFVFLIPLSLTPLATNMMASNTTRIPVMAYGVLLFVVSASFRLLTRSVMRFEYTDKSKMRQLYRKIFGRHNQYYIISNAILIVLAYFFPQIVLWFYLPYPLVYLILSSRNRQQMYDASQLTTEQRMEYLKLPQNAINQFRDMVQDQAATGTDGATTEEHHPQRGFTGWLDHPVATDSAGHPVNPTVPSNNPNSVEARKERQAQWEEFAKQIRDGSKKYRDTAERIRKEQRDTNREAVKQASRTAEQQQDQRKHDAETAAKEAEIQREAREKASKQAAKETERQQDADKESAKQAAKDIERQAKAKRRAAHEEDKILEHQQKTQRRTERRDAKHQAKLQKLQGQTQPHDAGDKPDSTENNGSENNQPKHDD